MMAGGKNGNGRISAAYDKIAEEYGDIVVAGKINIDENPQLAKDEQIEVIPTLVLYKFSQRSAGKVTGRVRV